jgi:hypothetical protein
MDKEMLAEEIKTHFAELKPLPETLHRQARKLGRNEVFFSVRQFGVGWSRLEPTPNYEMDGDKTEN